MQVTATSLRPAPLNPPTCAALAMAEGMTRTAYRVRVEWRTLLAFTAEIADAEAYAVDPRTGRLDRNASRHLVALREHRLQCVLELMRLGVPLAVITTGTEDH